MFDVCILLCESAIHTLWAHERTSAIQVIPMTTKSLKQILPSCDLQKKCMNICISYFVPFLSWIVSIFYEVFNPEKLAYRSVDDFTSSCFHNPHISCRVVDANKIMFTSKRKPIGPKKYTNTSMSPVYCWLDNWLIKLLFDVYLVCLCVYVCVCCKIDNNNLTVTSA